ncbi:DUF4435 domain-containing protein [Vibrio sp. Vb0937]|uniref:DUF4435 domain-containing protein n=1 Tax=unclassified Vibrio TaxID=2614977 RepID=UPI0029647635|nr:MULTISPECIES: DUF4435 domain-containing protein [unclassified Vibrio]MDW1824034.1 DUF4435 domain-containing protein [Vibrio sp. Vb0937]MDW3185449.1 DUF4435 domain-containing protein [Vibrio sp. Vb0932]
MGLERKLISKRAKAVFYTEYNDIDIFIEDTAVGYKKLFNKLISRYFKDEFTISDIFPLGGRDQVIKACKDDQIARGRPRIYIVDGDLYLLTGEQQTLKGLYVLPRYCIENHLICPNSITHLLEEEDPDKDYEHLAQKLDYEGWIQSTKDSLLNLFVEYAVAKKLTPHLQTVQYGYRGLISSGDGSVDNDKVEQRITQLSTEVKSIVTKEEYDMTRADISSKVNYANEDLLKYVSAKDILFPLLMLRMQRTVKFKVPNLTVKHRLSNTCPVDTFEGLKDHINAA